MALLARLCWPLFALALVLPATAVSAPSATPDPNFWVVNGVVHAVAADSSRIYLGGEFSTVGPYTGGAAPLDPTSGVRDSGFPGVDGFVDAAVADGSGGWYIAGDFVSVGGVARSNVAHVLAGGTVDPAFVADTDNEVRTLALKSSNLYLGGSFTAVNGTAKHALAKVAASTGALDATWDPNPSGGVFSGIVRALAASDAGLYVGGNFTSIGGQSRTDLAIVGLTGTGAADSTFVSNLGGGGDGVNTMLLSGSSLYIGGIFNAVNATAKTNLAAVDPTDGTALSFDANTDSSVWALALSGAKLYVGGFFSKITHSSTDTARQSLGAVNASTGVVDTTFVPSAPDNGVTALATDGTSVFVGGRYRHLGTSARNHLAKLSATDGSLDGTFDPTPDRDVNVLALSGGKVFAGGEFSSINGVLRHNLAAIDVSTGAAVAGWDPDVDDQVHTLLLLGGKLYAGGEFLNIDGTGRNRIAALDPATGTLDPTFHPNFDGHVKALAGDSGRLYVGGRFDQLDGVDSHRLAAVNPASGAPLWRGDVTGYEVTSLALGGSRLYAGGFFDHIGGSARDNLGAVSPATGAVDGTSSVGADDEVDALAVDGGRLYVGGFFAHLGGAARGGVGAIDTGTSTVADWSPPTTDPEVAALLPSVAGLYVGGNMSQLGGRSASGLGELDFGTGAGAPWDPIIPSTHEVESLALAGPRLVVGGRLSTDGNVNVNLRVYDFSPPSGATAPSVKAAAGGLSCDPGAWTNGPVKLGYGWQRDGAAVAGASAGSLATTAGDVGHSFSCTVTATNEAGTAQATSNPFLLAANGPTPPARDAKKPKMRIARLVRSGRKLKVTLGCPADEQFCSGTVGAGAVVPASARTKKVRLGSAKFTIAGGKRKTVTIKLSRKALRIVTKRHKVTVTVNVRDAAGNRASASRKFRVK